ncbi:G-protein coupled receptor moody-like [Ornithodoros turicata]|uniref:G-protein coupled receptor moody-like n=1 Tax=Ornithodoros turicata TaxID=34597 RepID=UPI00313924F1
MNFYDEESFPNSTYVNVPTTTTYDSNTTASRGITTTAALSTLFNTESFTNTTIVVDAFLFKNYPPVILKTGFVFLLVFAVFGVFANAVSMLAIVRCSKLKNATTSFLVNLCFSDLLFCGTSTPFAVSVFWYGGWNYSHSTCVVYGVSRFFNVGSSVLTVMVIAINRLVMIAQPTRYKQTFTPGNNLLIITGIWLLSFSLVIWPTARVWGRFAWDPYTGTCSVVPHNGKSSKQFTLTFVYIVPTIVFLSCYGRIFCIVRSSNKNLRQHNSGRRRSTAYVASMVTLPAEKNKKQVKKREKNVRLLRMVLVIFVTFTLCYLPLLLLKAFRILNHCPAVQVTAYMTFYLSGCLNPVIYICMSREYRKAYSDLFSRDKASPDVTASRDLE